MERQSKFLEYCKEGHLELAKSIYYKKYKDYKSFIGKEGNDDEHCNWLISLENQNLDIHYEEDEAFRLACFNGHLDIVKWLLTLEDKPNINAKNDEAFIQSCANGQLDIIKWLLTLEDKPNIRNQNDNAFKLACIFDRIKIAKLLRHLCDEYYFEIDKTNEKIKNWKIIYKNGNIYDGNDNKCTIC